MRRKRQEYYPEKESVNLFVVLGFLVFGFYFLNYPFKFISIPEFVSNYDSWIIFAGGVLLIFGVINYFQAKRR
ncbi:MAG: hypothetical protein KKF68_04025 [Nanoarchaeota archaeon]|nr:hypothetical protein [Nanoarchaeota archaeon]